ncbi:MAG: TrkH family potassium uptake protein [Candidatus Methanomethylophilaceae archaeon]|nr:TrkH family potassium uptake protein [Candidatus Methanomethylophilaceae archaeon]
MQKESAFTELKKNGLGKSFPLHTVGYVLIAESILMFLCTVVLGFREERIVLYALASVTGAVVGALLLFLFRSPNRIDTSTGVFTMVFLWAAAIAYGCIPYVIYGFSTPDAIFESISGFTTTGMSIVTNVAELPPSILVWRATTGWAGGIGFIIVFCLMLKFFNLNNRNLFVSEGLNSTVSNSNRSIRNLALNFIAVYTILTGILAVILAILGNDVIDSVCISMSTISTTGFSTLNEDLMGMSMASKTFIAIFLLLSAMNFMTLFDAVTGMNIRRFLEDSEIRHMIYWLIGSSVALLIILDQSGYMDWNATNVVNTILMVISIGTTTGFVFYNFSWPTVAMLFLSIIAMIGGCRESPTGGIKISRISLIFKSLRNTISTVGFPNEVRSVRLGGVYVKESICYAGILTVLLFFITSAVGTLSIMLSGVDVMDAFYLCISSLTTTGTGLYSVANVASIPNFAQGVMCALMCLGRMEIMLILVMFTPTFWKEFSNNIRASMYRIANSIKRT